MLSDLDEGLGGNAKPLMQSPDHIERQLAPAIEHFVHPIAAADKGDEIARLRSACSHRLHRIADASDKPDIDHAIGIVDPHDDAIFVTRDIKDRPTVLQKQSPPASKINSLRMQNR